MVDGLLEHYQKELDKLRQELDENRRTILLLKIQNEQLKNQLGELKINRLQ